MRAVAGARLAGAASRRTSPTSTDGELSSCLLRTWTRRRSPPVAALRWQSTIPAALRHSDSPSSSSSAGLSFGQPLPSTHPHLLAQTELTVGTKASEYEQRRRSLMEMVEPGSVVIVPGGRVKWMAHHIFYKFRQASDFWYLTGWEEPDSVLVLEKTHGKRGYKMTMLVPPKDLDWETWNGPRTGLDGAVNIFGADEAVDISQLATFLRPILTKSSASSVYVDLPTDVPFLRPSTKRPFSFTSSDPSASGPAGRSSNLLDYISPRLSQYADLANLTSALHRGAKADLDACLTALASATSASTRSKPSRPISPLAPKTDQLRAIKSPSEIALLRRAADISSRAHQRAMRLANSRPGLTEHSLVAEFESCCAREGSVRPAYVPVCAAGPAGLTVHYTSNDRRLPDGATVLLDAGCEYGGYASDITRTFPIAPPGSRAAQDRGAVGKFSSPQADLYGAVLSAEKDLVKVCAESEGETLGSLHRKSCDLLRGELRRLGFGLGPGQFEQLYPHYVGHPIGVDLHDTPSFDRTTRLRSGMVLTVEPGVYVPDSSAFPRHFRGLAVRVEDEVLVRDDDVVVLSVSAPKEVVDVEACCSGLLEDVNPSSSSSTG